MLPQIKEWFVADVMGEGAAEFRAAVEEYVEYAAVRHPDSARTPVKLLLSTDSPIPVLLEGARGCDQQGLCRLPEHILHKILDEAFAGKPAAINVGSSQSPKLIDPHRVFLFAGCPRPYGIDPLFLLKDLDSDFEFSWKHASYTRLDPLSTFADKVMDLLKSKLPGVFAEEQEDDDDWRDYLAGILFSLLRLFT